MSTLTVPDNFYEAHITSKAYIHQQLVQFYCNFNRVNTDIVKSSKGK